DHPNPADPALGSKRAAPASTRVHAAPSTSRVHHSPELRSADTASYTSRAATAHAAGLLRDRNGTARIAPGTPYAHAAAARSTGLTESAEATGGIRSQARATHSTTRSLTAA